MCNVSVISMPDNPSQAKFPGNIFDGRIPQCTFQILGGLSGSEDKGGGDNSVQFINFGRVGDKSFKE